MNKYIPLFLLLMTVTLFSCSTKRQLAQRITDTWDVVSYEEQTDQGRNISLENIGTITFYSNGRGENDIHYKVFNNTHSDQSEFTWKNTENVIFIEGEHAEFAHSWFVLENKTNEQMWKTTDGKGNITTIKLEK